MTPEEIKEIEKRIEDGINFINSKKLSSPNQKAEPTTITPEQPNTPELMGEYLIERYRPYAEQHFKKPTDYDWNATQSAIVSAEVAESVETKWIRVNHKLPPESGRYLCYVEEVNDLWISHFQWNCSFHKSEKRFSDECLKGGKVTHWMPLPKPPHVITFWEQTIKYLQSKL